MKTAKINVTANWDGEKYVVGAWTSADGDSWILADGTPASGENFDAATIVLSGGPRHGETVA